MTEFTPVSALIGGSMIGASAALLAVGANRVAGISGIVGGLLRPSAGDRAWRLAFLIGLPAGAAGTWFLGLGQMPVVEASNATLVVAGLLVGFGTRLGNGCTSGHGICGTSRGSKRSILATATFMATGALTVFAMRHLIGGLS